MWTQFFAPLPDCGTTGTNKPRCLLYEGVKEGQAYIKGLLSLMEGTTEGRTLQDGALRKFEYCTSEQYTSGHTFGMIRLGIRTSAHLVELSECMGVSYVCLLPPAGLVVRPASAWSAGFRAGASWRGQV